MPSIKAPKNSEWPNGLKLDSENYVTFYPLGTNKITDITSFNWPTGNKIISPFVYQDDKLVGFCDTEAIAIPEDGTETTISLPSYSEIEISLKLKNQINLNIQLHPATNYFKLNVPNISGGIRILGNQPGEEEKDIVINAPDLTNANGLLSSCEHINSLAFYMPKLAVCETMFSETVELTTEALDGLVQCIPQGNGGDICVGWIRLYSTAILYKDKLAEKGWNMIWYGATEDSNKPGPGAPPVAPYSLRN